MLKFEKQEAGELFQPRPNMVAQESERQKSPGACLEIFGDFCPCFCCSVRYLWFLSVLFQPGFQCFPFCDIGCVIALLPFRFHSGWGRRGRHTAIQKKESEMTSASKCRCWHVGIKAGATGAAVWMTFVTARCCNLFGCRLLGNN